MAQREPRTSVSNFARGSELWVHQARLVLVAIRNLLLASVVITLIFGSGYFYFVSSDLKLYALERN
nr:hypothetical protein [Rhodoferax sp.]